jgi:hypothetical protein
VSGKRCGPAWRLGLLASLLIGTAHAHSVGTSYLQIAAQDKDPSMRLELSLRDLEFAVGLDSNGDARIVWKEVLARSAAITDYVRGHLQIERDGRACTWQAAQLAIERRDTPYLVLDTPLACVASGAIAVRSTLLFDVDADHRTLLSVRTASTVVSVLTASANSWRATDGSFTRFVRQGIGHILAGFDHLAFLLLLLLPLARSATSAWSNSWNILRVVTAFTAAHSITLALAAFDYIKLPSRWVEAAIAASIVFAAVVSLQKKSPRYGLAMAFGFGLVHGIGFAGSLAELTGNSARLLPLVGFNLGVEIGQLLVVLALLPLLFAWQPNLIWKQRAVAAASLAIGALGLMWLVQRTLLS